MSGGLASCIYVLVRLAKHFQQILGCSSYLYLDSSWIWAASNGSFLQRLQMTSSSLTHPSEGTCFRLTIHSFKHSLSVYYTFSNADFGNPPPGSAHGWVPPKIRNTPPLKKTNKYSSVNHKVSAWLNMKSLKMNFFSLKSLFRLFRRCGPGTYFANQELFNILLVYG